VAAATCGRRLQQILFRTRGGALPVAGVIKAFISNEWW